MESNDEYVNVRPHTKKEIERIGDITGKYNYKVVDLAVASLLEDVSSELSDQYRAENELDDIKELLQSESQN